MTVSPVDEHAAARPMPLSHASRIAPFDSRCFEVRIVLRDSRMSIPSPERSSLPARQAFRLIPTRHYQLQR
jgi:hypothetical protein